MERSRPDETNKGREAALTGIEMVRLLLERCLLPAISAGSGDATAHSSAVHRVDTARTRPPSTGGADQRTSGSVREVGMGDTAEKDCDLADMADLAVLGDPSHEPDQTDPAGDRATEPSPVDPTQIRYRPGVRREGAFRAEYVMIDGYRGAYVKVGSGPAVLLIHGIGDSSDTWRPVVDAWPGTTRSSHRTCSGTDARRNPGPTTRSPATPTGCAISCGARGPPGHRRRAFARRGRGGPVRLPVSRSVRAPRAGRQRGSGPHGCPLLRLAAVPGVEALMPLLGLPPYPLRQPARRRVCCACSTPRSGATPRRSWPRSTHRPTPRRAPGHPA